MKNKLREFFSIENRTKYFTHVLFYLCIAFIIIFALLIIGTNSLNNKKTALKEKPDYYKGINLEARGVIVWDLINQRELFSKNPDEPLPLASLTKVMTALTAREKLADEELVEITQEDLGPEGDSQLIAGDTWRAKDLRDFTLVTSSNDGALALASVVQKNSKNNSESEFTKNMNEVATKIGLLSSRFFNEHGLDKNADRGGAYGSARDMAALFEYTLKSYPEILEATRYKNLEFKSHEKRYSAENTNVIIDKIPNIIASKTGYTDLAGGNLVIAFNVDLNRPIIISVLGSSEEGRFSDMLQLVEASLKQINSGI